MTVPSVGIERPTWYGPSRGIRTDASAGFVVAVTTVDATPFAHRPLSHVAVLCPALASRSGVPDRTYCPAAYAGSGDDRSGVPGLSYSPAAYAGSNVENLRRPCPVRALLESAPVTDARSPRESADPDRDPFFSTGGTLAVDVEVRSDGVQLRVHDDGPGIAPENLPHIFERFHRVDPARARSGGAGLGLAIVAAAVERHEGTVMAESNPGEGTTIIITIPS